MCFGGSVAMGAMSRKDEILVGTDLMLMPHTVPGGPPELPTSLHAVDNHILADRSCAGYLMMAGMRIIANVGDVKLRHQRVVLHHPEKQRRNYQHPGTGEPFFHSSS